MTHSDKFESVKLLISRLERLSADSYWAHRASGIRGALLRYIEKMTIQEDDEQSFCSETINIIIQTGYSLLEKAAREIPKGE